MDAKVENKEEKTCECNECNCEEECKCDEECTCEKEQKKEKKKDKYKKQIQELEEKIKGYEEKSLRDKAEMINYRRRKEEETSKMLKYCNEDLIKQLLPVIDNFERAIKMDDDNLEDEVSKFLSSILYLISSKLLSLTSTPAFKSGVVFIETARSSSPLNTGFVVSTTCIIAS